jgi:hypothetical protein
MSSSRSQHFPQLRFAWLDVEDQAAPGRDLDIELSRPCWWQSHAALDFGALTPSRAHAVAAAGISDGCDLHRRRGTHTPIDLASLLACTHTLSFNVPTCVLILTCVRFHAAKGCFCSKQPKLRPKQAFLKCDSIPT